MTQDIYLPVTYLGPGMFSSELILQYRNSTPTAFGKQNVRHVDGSPIGSSLLEAGEVLLLICQTHEPDANPMTVRCNTVVPSAMSDFVTTVRTGDYVRVTPWLLKGLLPGT